MTLIDGKAIAERLITSLATDLAKLRAAGQQPGLAVVIIGSDPASLAYVRSKDRKCRELGMHSVKHELPESTTQEELIALVQKLNADPAIHGILVQSPPPRH